MRTRLLAAFLVVGLLAALTIQGVGPLAASDDTNDAAPVANVEPTTSATTPAPPVDGASSTTPADDVGTTASTDDDPATPASADADGDTTTDAKSTAKASASTASPDVPLGDLTAAQQASFDAANAALINLTNVKGTPLTTRVDAVTAACTTLDGARLSVALAESCSPTIKVVKLSAIYAKRCADFSGGACTRTNRRLAEAVDDLVRAQRSFARALRADVPAGACRQVLLPKGKELRAASAFADAIRAVATAIDGGDRDTIIRAAAAADAASSKFSSDDRAAPAIVREYRAACRL